MKQKLRFYWTSTGEIRRGFSVQRELVQTPIAKEGHHLSLEVIRSSDWHRGTVA